MTEEGNQRIHAIVEGLVQGVGFRYSVIEISNRLHLTGWVRNTVNGHVEVVAEGPRANLENLISFLKIGPRSAQVNNVKIEWLSTTGEFNNFNVHF